MTSRRVAAFAFCLLPLAVSHAQAPSPAATATPATSAPATPALCLVVKFKARPGKNAEMEAAFREMQAGVRANEPGNAQYDFFVEAGDPQTYVIIERYKDQAAMQAHGTSAHGKKLIAQLKDLTDAPTQADRLVLISAK